MEKKIKRDEQNIYKPISKSVVEKSEKIHNPHLLAIKVCYRNLQAVIDRVSKTESKTKVYLPFI